MEKRAIYIIILATLLTSISMSVFNIRPVKASEIIYIRADGRIDPQIPSILKNMENTSYIFTSNIYASIVVERNNIIIDGAGYTLEGAVSGTGINLTNVNNVTIKNLKIKMFNEGIRLYNSSNNTIYKNNITECNWYAIFAIWAQNNRVFENNIANNGDGVWFKGLSANNIISRNNVTANKYIGIGLSGVSNNSVLGNNIVNNSYGIWIKLSSSNNIVIGNCIMSNHIYGVWFRESSNNTVSHNNFINQTQQAYSESSQNFWDDGYPSGGNYWSDYLSIDTDSDGIGEMPYTIDLNNTDRYPLFAQISIFDAGVWNETNYYVDVISNSTVFDFYFNPNEAFLSFKVTGETGAIGFCRVTIPKSMLWTNDEDEWIILVDEQPLVNYNVISDRDYTYLCFTYSLNAKTILIKGTNAIPEFASFTILLFFILTTSLFTFLWKNKNNP